MSEIVLVGNSALRTRCEEVDLTLLPSLNIETLLNRMHNTMKEERGIGLAANQIGVTMRIFILKLDDTSFKEYINPIITSAIELVPFEGEACLSVPGTSATTQRFRQVDLQWYDRNGTQQHSSFTDLQAFAVQHEMDHLDGKLYIDAFGPARKLLIMDKHRKYLKQVSRRSRNNLR